MQGVVMAKYSFQTFKLNLKTLNNRIQPYQYIITTVLGILAIVVPLMVSGNDKNQNQNDADRYVIINIDQSNNCTFN